jgi:hypothetical protein
MDYKDRIIERQEELEAEFEDERGRSPTQAESLELFRRAQDLVDEALADLGDHLRKISKGE